MGAVQGLSEFLPVSSSAHIVFTSALYKVFTGLSVTDVGQEEIFFDILIHLASLFAVIIFFFKDLKEIATGFFCGFKTKNYSTPEFKTGLCILISTFITCVIGFLIKDFADLLTKKPDIVAALLLVTGLILFSCEKIKRKEKPLDFKSAILIGLAQGLAVFPGFSRSGFTIATGMFTGLSRIKAARYSFILSVPIIFLASFVYPLLELDFKEVATFNFKAILTGCIMSFITGYLCIKFFMKFLEKFSLKIFAYYCWFIGAAIIISVLIP